MNAKNGYDKLKSAYHKIPLSFFNKYVEIPAVKKLLENINGKKVLDIGCASGTHTEIIYKKGAIVTGIDISKEMIALAQKRLPSVSFKVANMKKMPFDNNSFDILFYGLCIHYEKNLETVFKEAYRILKPHGKIIISTHSPYWVGLKKIKVNDKTYWVVDDYFDDRQNKMKFSNINLTIYPKTISGLFNPIIKNGFCIKNIIEPQPIKNSRKYDTKAYDQTIKIPSFILIEAVKI